MLLRACYNRMLNSSLHRRNTDIADEQTLDVRHNRLLSLPIRHPTGSIVRILHVEVVHVVKHLESKSQRNSLHRGNRNTAWIEGIVERLVLVLFGVHSKLI